MIRSRWMIPVDMLPSLFPTRQGSCYCRRARRQVRWCSGSRRHRFFAWGTVSAHECFFNPAS